VLGDADSLSEWGASDDGTGSRPSSAAPSPDRRPSALLPCSLRHYAPQCTHPNIKSPPYCKGQHVCGWRIAAHLYYIRTQAASPAVTLL